MAMPVTLKAIFDSIPHQVQRQDSTNAQLHDLMVYALRLGLTKAVANLTRLVDETNVTRVVTLRVLEGIEGQATSEGSTKDQLQWLRAFGNRLGLYDAVDILRIRLEGEVTEPESLVSEALEAL